MRVAIAAESFLPFVNGVTTSVVRLAEHLRHRGHEPLIVAPGPGDRTLHGIPVVRAPSRPVPLYRECRVGVVDDETVAAIERFAPDVVHLAAPFVLGRRVGRLAADRGVPVVAAYQTDVAGFAHRYHLAAAEPVVWRMVRRAHDDAALTLAPSTVSAFQLAERGIGPVAVWPRGVDQRSFHPRHRDDGMRHRLAPRGEVIVGYVGRLAREKQLERLRPLAERPGVRLVVVGDGPRRAALERMMPQARFVGFRRGRQLSQLVASLDVFVHPGVHETFCQALQEAMAAGVPVVAPAAGGPLDLVHHGVNGFLWSPLAPETLVGAVAELAGDERLRQRLGAAARRSVASRTWPAVLDAAIDHYHDVLGARRLASSA